MLLWNARTGVRIRESGAKHKVSQLGTGGSVDCLLGYGGGVALMEGMDRGEMYLRKSACTVSSSHTGGCTSLIWTACTSSNQDTSEQWCTTRSSLGTWSSARITGER